ncbi:Tfp pilus assembly protein PilF [Candidatus Moduliflexus flocculans]|uniref:Tfp pilus assembly protein PilF n=1 Tax=Candidatus Moduliflexus flocculans TaxID=1499966 RepID=A0A081BP52_9BACT|nr:Tfp pilus assembly protein PilF [Candidatus Moduliflexus flocculans]
MMNRSRSSWWGIVVGILLIVLAGCSTTGTTPKPQPTQKPKPTVSSTAEAKKLVEIGVARLEAGDVNKAISSFQKAIKVDPKNAEAAQYLKQAEQKKAEMIDTHLKQGIKYFNSEQLEQAMTEWNKVLTLDPRHAKALDYKQRTQAQLDALKGK